MRADAAMRRSVRSGTPLSLAVIDLDGFKEINDARGHSAGDDVLQGVVREWQAGTRPGDVICRMGGDEFAVLLPGADEARARAIMSRLRADSAFAWTWGVAQAADDDTLATLVMHADRAMYEAKPGR